MADEIQSYKLVCSGGVNSYQNHLYLSEAASGAATRLINYEPSLYGGYRRIEGYDLLGGLDVEVGAGVAEGPVLCVAIYRNEHIGKLAYKMGLHEWYILSKSYDFYNSICTITNGAYASWTCLLCNAGL